MRDRFALGGFSDPADLPEVQRALHRRIMAAAAADRAARLPAPRSEDERRWPGLHKPKRSRKPTR